MKWNLALSYYVVLVAQVVTTGAFLLPSSQQPTFAATATRLASTSSSSEVERLLAKAAALRAEAEKAEHQVHSQEATKKKQHDEDMDRRIEFLFSNGKSKMQVVKQLKTKRYCIDTLKDIVTRLHERELKASGKEHVDHTVHNDHTDIQRTSDEVNESELMKLNGLIDRLIEAVGVLDAELKANKEKSGNVHVNHIEDEHFGGLDSAKRLEQYYHEIRREHEEQFQKRQEEFFEAQRINKDNKTPPKQKDHMMHP